MIIHNYVLAALIFIGAILILSAVMAAREAQKKAIANLESENKFLRSVLKEKEDFEYRKEFALYLKTISADFKED